jgi:hypothetical protein
VLARAELGPQPLEVDGAALKPLASGCAPRPTKAAELTDHHPGACWTHPAQRADDPGNRRESIEARSPHRGSSLTGHLLQVPGAHRPTNERLTRSARREQNAR